MRTESIRRRTDSPDDEINVTGDGYFDLGRAARADALERFELGEREKAAMLTVAPFLDNPAELGKVLNSIRRPAKVQAETLRAFLRRTGGITDESSDLPTWT